ncbi:MAG: P1 family peptidase [Chloroflexi bacterium]|nr:P1 family peptidase [Chloroflexota bacterium]
MARARMREVGITTGELPTGRLNAITDVAGVKVGHTTLVSGDGPLRPGAGPVRTGVTVILPHGGNLFREKAPAAVQTINGFGKPTGFEQVRELGNIETPIALTSTLNVGRVFDALVDYAISQSPEIGIRTTSVNPLVGETNDSHLNDIQGRHVTTAHVLAAIASAAEGAVAEGCVGAGTGTVCYGWKGGIGTASRIGRTGYTVGALVQSNFGASRDLCVGPTPVGRHIEPPVTAPADRGSIMIVLATDAPCDARQLHRLCGRVSAGLARTGSLYGHGSGDFAVAFSTAYRITHEAPDVAAMRPAIVREESMDDLFRAVVEATEEAVLNSLFTAETTVGRDDHVRYALPVDDVLALVRRYAG